MLPFFFVENSFGSDLDWKCAFYYSVVVPFLLDLLATFTFSPSLCLCIPITVAPSTVFLPPAAIDRSSGSPIGSRYRSIWIIPIMDTGQTCHFRINRHHNAPLPPFRVHTPFIGGRGAVHIRIDFLWFVLFYVSSSFLMHTLSRDNCPSVPWSCQQATPPNVIPLFYTCPSATLPEVHAPACRPLHTCSTWLRLERFSTSLIGNRSTGAPQGTLYPRP